MANKNIRIGNYEINDESFPYLIAEIGINHNGDLSLAKRLLDATYACGWNCAKFQKRTPDIAVPEAQKNLPKDTPWGPMTYLEYKKKIEFEKPEYDYIDTYCKEKPLSWTASPWDIESLEFLLQYDIPFIKIASACNMDFDLLKNAAQSKKALFVSTGMSTIEELDKIVNFLESHTNGDYILLHTNSAYPSPQHELNLRMIPALAERFNCLVGYSGHEKNLVPTVVAASLGAKVLERHVTLDHTLWGTDQSSSLEVRGMAMLRDRIESILDIMGDGQKVLTDIEKEMRKKLRRE